MKKTVLKLIAFAVIGGLLFSCEKNERGIPQPKPGNQEETPDPEPEPDGDTFTIEPAPYKVVAHRGGSSECGAPDNSRASLRYAMGLKCYASECDIYWTKDNKIVIAHADGNCKINGLYPWEATLEQIQKGGLLKNGETIPSLEDFLDIVMVKGNCTKLWLDIKNITSPSTLTQYPINAVQRACQIIRDRKAEAWCEFICTGNETVASAAQACMTSYKIPVGWMAKKTPTGHKAKGFTWANENASSAMTPYYTTNTVDAFVNAGMEISVFNVDRQEGDGNAVFSNSDVAYYVQEYPKMKAVCTNYPAWFIGKIK